MARPHIEAVAPSFALPGGEVRIRKEPPSARTAPHERPLGDIEGSCSSVPTISCRPRQRGAGRDRVVVGTNGHMKQGHSIKLRHSVPTTLIRLTNSALDREGNLYVTLLRITRGKKFPYRSQDRHELQR